MKKRKALLLLITAIVTILVGIGIFYYFNRTKYYRNYLLEVKTTVTQCELGKHENEYNKLINEFNNAIKKMDINSLMNIKDKLEKLKQSIVTDNENKLKEQINEIKKIDISELNSDDKKYIQREYEQINNLYIDHKFKKCTTKINELNSTINKDIEKKQTEDVNKALNSLNTLVGNNELDKAQNIISQLHKNNLSSEQTKLLKNIEDVVNQKYQD